VLVNEKRYIVWCNADSSLECFWTEQPAEFQTLLECKLNLHFVLYHSGKPTSFELQPIPSQGQSHTTTDLIQTLELALSRPSLDSLFEKQLAANIKLDNTAIPVEFNLPFEINILMPTQMHLASMTPQRFIHLLQQTPGFFVAVGTTTIMPPANMATDAVCDLIARSISCIVVERHPAGCSLYGALCNGSPIVGLCKEKRNSKGNTVLTLDIKTGDARVLEWVMEIVSKLASEFL
jgi:hypothetical protein